MTGHDEDDFGSDDLDLDDLGNDYLTELENNAIQFTQAQARTKVVPSSDYGDGIDDEDFDDAVVIDESRSTPAISTALQRNLPGQPPREHFHQFRQQHDGLGTISNPRAQLPNRQQLASLPPPPQSNHPRQVPVQNAITQHDSMVAQQGSQLNEGMESMQKQIQEVRLYIKTF